MRLQVEARRLAQSSPHPTSPLPQREHEQRIAARRAGRRASRRSRSSCAASSCRIGGGLTMSNRRKSRKANADAHAIRADEEEHQQECDDFVADDRAVVGHAEIAAGHVPRPRCRATNRTPIDGDDTRRRLHGRAARSAIGIATQRAERSRRDRRQSGAEAQRDEVRRMREQEPRDGRPRSPIVLQLGNDRRHAAASGNGTPRSSRTTRPAPAVIVPMRASGNADVAPIAATRAAAARGAVKHSS